MGNKRKKTSTERWRKTDLTKEYKGKTQPQLCNRIATSEVYGFDKIHRQNEKIISESTPHRRQKIDATPKAP